MEYTENETSSVAPSVISAGSKSHKKTKPAIDPETRLRILTQAAYDIQECQECQEQDIEISFLAIPGGMAIIVLGTELSQEQIMVPRRD